MKLLTYNSLDKCYSNHQIKGAIGLHSFYIYRAFIIHIIVDRRGYDHISTEDLQR